VILEADSCLPVILRQQLIRAQVFEASALERVMRHRLGDSHFECRKVDYEAMTQPMLEIFARA